MPAVALQPRTGRRQPGPVLVADAVEAFLATPRRSASAHTQRAYALVLHRVADQLGRHRPLAEAADAELGQALTALWDGRAPSTWNRNRAPRLLAGLVPRQGVLARAGPAGHLRAPQGAAGCDQGGRPGADRPDLHPPRHPAARAAAVADAAARRRSRLAPATWLSAK